MGSIAGRGRGWKIKVMNLLFLAPRIREDRYSPAHPCSIPGLRHIVHVR